VELSSDWLTGCGAPLPEGKGGRRGRMTEQRLGCEKQLFSFSVHAKRKKKKMSRDERKPSPPPTGQFKRCQKRRE